MPRAKSGGNVTLASAREATIRLAVKGTVLLSIFAHGLSATPGIGLYQRRIASLDPAAPEFPVGQQVKRGQS
jgi:hypothetical protein